MSRSARPRVLVAITLAEVGGAQTYVMNLLPALTERYDVTVAAWGPGPLREASLEAGARYVPLRDVRRPIHPRDTLGLLELVELFRRERPHLVHLNSSKVGLLGGLAARITGIPAIVFTVNGWAFSTFGPPASHLYRRLARSLPR